MERSVELPVSLPGLRAVRAITASLHTGVKEHYGVGRIEPAIRSGGAAAGSGVPRPAPSW